MSDQLSLLSAAKKFQGAVKNWHVATTEMERLIAAEAIEKARTVLILDHGYTLEMLCDLVDGVQ